MAFREIPRRRRYSIERVGQRKLQFGSEVLNLGEFLEPLSSTLKETLGSVIPETPSVSSNLVSLHRLAPIGVFAFGAFVRPSSVSQTFIGDFAVAEPSWDDAAAMRGACGA